MTRKFGCFLYDDGDASSPGFTEQLITSSANGARSVYATDMNGDGAAADILVALSGCGSTC